jgi:hypothetical protein
MGSAIISSGLSWEKKNILKKYYKWFNKSSIK